MRNLGTKKLKDEKRNRDMMTRRLRLRLYRQGRTGDQCQYIHKIMQNLRWFAKFNIYFSFYFFLSVLPDLTNMSLVRDWRSCWRRNMSSLRQVLQPVGGTQRPEVITVIWWPFARISLEIGK